MPKPAIAIAVSILLLMSVLHIVALLDQPPPRVAIGRELSRKERVHVGGG